MIPADDQQFEASLSVATAEWLNEHSVDLRWYADKSRTLMSAHVVDWTTVSDLPSEVILCIVDLEFEHGSPSRYFLPLAITQDANSGHLLLSDALADPVFLAWFGEFMHSRKTLVTRFGTLASLPFSTLEERPIKSVRAITAEQSNSSIVIDEVSMAKIYRQLRPGINPEIAVGHYLKQFPFVPATLGALQWDVAGEPPMSVAVLQEYLPLATDGWAQVQSDISTGMPSIQPAELGTVTAKLHLALARPTWNAEFDPVPLTKLDVEDLSSKFLDSLTQTTRMIRSEMMALNTPSRELMQAFLAISNRLERHAESFALLAGTTKIHVHGDYHLGQILHTQERGLVIVDFEGEPNSSLESSTLITSPLKDLAGMLRSFSYARGSAEGGSRTGSDLANWEGHMRQEFLAAYRSTANAANATFLPESVADFEQALTAWEIDKALYEIRYEIASRPDWLHIPLAAVLRNAG